jgi:hypothetical protein
MELLLVTRTSVYPQLGKIVEGHVTFESFNGDKDNLDGKKR